MLQFLCCWNGSRLGFSSGRKVLAFATPLFGELADSSAVGAALFAGGLTVSVAFKPPGALPLTSTGPPPADWSKGGQADTHGAVWSPGLLQLCLLTKWAAMSVCTVAEAAGGGSSTVTAALRSCLARMAPADSSHPHGELAVMWAHSTAPDDTLLPPRGGVVFTCNGRGADFHEEPLAESRALETALPGCAAAGFFSGGEIGPTSMEKSQARTHGHGSPECGLMSFACVVAMLA